MEFGNDVILDILDRQNRANLRGSARPAAMRTPPPLNFTRWRISRRRLCGSVSSEKTTHQTVISGICAETGITSRTTL